MRRRRAGDDAAAQREWQRIARARDSRARLGLEVHAGHGLDYATAETIAALPEIVELNIGHFLIGEAVFVGLAARRRTMRAAMERGRAQSGLACMILGIGTDLIDIRRIEQGDRAPRRALPRPHLHRDRARRAERRANRIETYAKRFAAKEACAKALGTGLRNGVFWRDMGVVNLPSGQPTMQLTGGALARLRGDHAGRLRGADRSHHHRRRPDGAGLRDHLGGAASSSGMSCVMRAVVRAAARGDFCVARIAARMRVSDMRKMLLSNDKSAVRQREASRLIAPPASSGYKGAGRVDSRNERPMSVTSQEQSGKKAASSRPFG